MTTHTPWGWSQGATKYADGIVFHTTARHGGFKLSPAANAKVHEAWRRDNGWYEEDCEACIVVFTFPDAFSVEGAPTAQQAREGLINWFPDEWEAVTGEKIEPGESYKRDHELFLKAHANDWIVVSAARRGELVSCIATLGGKRRAGGELPPTAKTFLIPHTEYDAGRFGFIIDPAKHKEIV